MRTPAGGTERGAGAVGRGLGGPACAPGVGGCPRARICGGGGGQRGRGGNQDSGNRKPERRGWESMRMGGSNNTGDGLASQPRRYWVLGQPLLKRHQVGGVSCSPDGLFAQQEGEPTRGRPAVRGKGYVVDGLDNAWRSRAPGPHTHGNAARQVMDGLRTEVCGQQKQSNDPHSNQYNLNTPTTGRR